MADGPGRAFPGIANGTFGHLKVYAGCPLVFEMKRAILRR